MQSQKPYLCMTCGGKKHTTTHKKYYARKYNTINIIFFNYNFIFI